MRRLPVLARRSVLAGLAALALSLPAAAVPSAAEAADELRFAVTDLAGLEQLQAEFGPFVAVLEEKTGRDIGFFPVNNRTAAVEAMASERLDFVLTGPAEYVVFQKRTQAVPVVAFMRPDYFSQIVVMADSPYQLPADLRGEKVAFGDVGSTSQHLGPAQVLADFGLVAGKDYQSVNISRNVAVEAMVRGDVAAVGMNFTHLQRIRKAFPEQKFRVVARGRDLPDDILLAGAHVPAETVEEIRALFLNNERALMDAMLTGEDNQKFSGGGFRTGVKDSDYNYVRSMYTTIGYPEYAEFVGE